MTKLSPAAQAVKDAAFHSVAHDRAHTLEARVAAALRAAAERLGYDSVYDIVCDSGEPNYRVDVSALLAIAAELEGAE